MTRAHTSIKQRSMKQRRATPRRRSVLHLVDEAYRAHLRRRPCVLEGCGRPRPGTQHEAHHHTGHERGLGQKGSDRYMFTLCLQHHTDFHAGSGPFKGWEKYQRRTWQDEHAEMAWIEYTGKLKAVEGVF